MTLALCRAGAGIVRWAATRARAVGRRTLWLSRDPWLTPPLSHATRIRDTRIHAEMTQPATESGPGARDWLLAAGLAGMAGALRAFDLNFPPTLILDEFWYARDGCYYWRHSLDACHLSGLVPPDRDVITWLATYGELTPEHPPLAKWLIGAPMAALDYGPGAARASALLAGTLTVVLLFLLVRRAFGSRPIAVGAAALLAIDYPHFVHSRIAMLEIFVGLFAVAAFLFIALDRDQITNRVMGAASHGWWRVAAGVAAGLAAASKLSGAAVIVGGLLLIYSWERAASHNGPRQSRWKVGTAVRVLLPLAAVPMVVYAVSFAGRIDGSWSVLPWAEGSWVHAFIERNVYMLSFHADKPSGLSSLWHVPMSAEPVSYFQERDQGGAVRQILLFGNPLLWWGGFGAVMFAVATWMRGHRTHESELVVVAFAAGFTGWLALTASGRTVHLFHAIAVAPFVYLALAYLAHRAVHFPRRGMLGTAVLGLSAVAFAFFLPVLVGQALDRVDWRARVCSAGILWAASPGYCDALRLAPE